MVKLLFQLGHCPDLSQAEIMSANQRLGVPLTELTRWGDEALLARTDSLPNAIEMCESLGGAIRLVEVGSSPGLSLELETLAREIADSDIVAPLRSLDRKPIFGLSLLGKPTVLGGKRKTLGWLHVLAARLKARLAENDRAPRFVLPDGDQDGFTLNGAQVEKNKLFMRGGEIVLLVDDEQRLTFGLSRWLHGFEAFSRRDYGRPQRDARSGMLPPKLARILINLAREDKSSTLLDPFCGSGSLLMEAALMGLEPVGVDRSAKAIEDTRANIHWMKERLDLRARIRAMEGDVRELRSLFEPLYFDCCATEPDLGPPLRSSIPTQKFDAISKKLSTLYIRALAEIRTVVKPGARVVFIMPRIRIEGREKPGTLSLMGDIKLMGYTPLDPLAGFVPTEKRATLVYARPDQTVQREIFVLEA